MVAVNHPVGGRLTLKTECGFHAVFSAKRVAVVSHLSSQVVPKGCEAEQTFSEGGGGLTTRFQGTAPRLRSDMCGNGAYTVETAQQTIDFARRPQVAR